MTEQPEAPAVDPTPTGDISHDMKLAKVVSDLESSLDGIRQIIAQSTGLPSGIEVRLDPEEVQTRMDAAGQLDATNDFVISYRGAEQRITLDDFVAHGVHELISDRLIKLGAMHTLTDRQIINALLARLGGEVELTTAEVAAAAMPITLQFDGLKIKLVKE